MKSVEDTYRLTTIKMANYLNNSDDKRIKCARTLEMNRITQGRRSIFKQATKYAAEYNIICNFDDTGTTISASKDSTAATETKTITTPVAYSAQRTTEIKDRGKIHQRSRRAEMAWRLHQQTAPRQTTASHSQPNPEEMEKYT